MVWSFAKLDILERKITFDCFILSQHDLWCKLLRETAAVCSRKNDHRHMNKSVFQTARTNTL